MKAGTRGSSFDILSERDMESIHSASLRVLEDPGVLSESDLILDIFAKGGAKVDRQNNVVQIPSELVEEALESAPESFVLHGRDPSKSIQIEPGFVYFGMGGTSEPYFWDYELGKPRSPTKADMASNTRVAETLPNIDFVMALCSARDMPTEQVFLHEYDAIFRNTTKPVVFSILGRKHTDMILEVAAAISGGEDELRENPWLLAYVTPKSPLTFGDLNEGILEAAAMDIPILYGVGPMMGATAPATVAGILAQANAEVLFGLVLSQLIKPGIPFVHSPHTPAMDMLTAQCTYGSAEQSLGRMAAAQLARFYRLPSFNTGGGVEAKLPDSQAASEAMMGMLLNGLTNMTMTQCLGTLASGLYGSVEMVVICDEIVHMVKHILGGISVSEDTLAVDVIKEVGPGGHFLDHVHTAQHFRQEMFFPVLFKRQSIDGWIEKGAKSMLEVAHEKVEAILAEAGPVTLPEGAEAELERVLEKAIREIKEEGSEA
jgi:trimethylamine--corrinoid protein Co-methyltransferase